MAQGQQLLLQQIWLFCTTQHVACVSLTEMRLLSLPINKAPLNFTSILTATWVEKAVCLSNCLQKLDLLIGKWLDLF